MWLCTCCHSPVDLSVQWHEAKASQRRHQYHLQDCNRGASQQTQVRGILIRPTQLRSWGPGACRQALKNCFLKRLWFVYDLITTIRMRLKQVRDSIFIRPVSGSKRQTCRQSNFVGRWELSHLQDFRPLSIEILGKSALFWSLKLRNGGPHSKIDFISWHPLCPVDWAKLWLESELLSLNFDQIKANQGFFHWVLSCLSLLKRVVLAEMPRPHCLPQCLRMIQIAFN